MAGRRRFVALDGALAGRAQFRIADLLPRALAAWRDALAAWRVSRVRCAISSRSCRATARQNVDGGLFACGLATATNSTPDDARESHATSEAEQALVERAEATRDKIDERPLADRPRD
jgi:hypothetical protein